MLDRRMLLRALLALSLLACSRSGSSASVDAPAERFHAGERWHYQTRPGEEGSTLTVLKVDASPRVGTIVHIHVDGLKLKTPPNSSVHSDQIGHMPFAEAAMEQSVTTMIAKDVPLPDFAPSYGEWRRAFENGKGGVFTITVAKGVDFVESNLNK
ncbi:MAG TPA: hypothetical protein VIF09_29130 [Polyangiaceae bacterium]